MKKKVHALAATPLMLLWLHQSGFAAMAESEAAETASAVRPSGWSNYIWFICAGAFILLALIILLLVLLGGKRRRNNRGEWKGGFSGEFEMPSIDGTGGMAETERMGQSNQGHAAPTERMGQNNQGHAAPTERIGQPNHHAYDLQASGGTVRLAPRSTGLQLVIEERRRATGENYTRAIYLDKTLVFGRNYECDYVIRDETTSGKHFEIKRESDGLYIIDLQSKNGTFLNGKMLRESLVLRNNDVIKAGSTTLRFQFED